MLGPIFTIEGIVSENDGEVTIDAWSNEPGFRWQAKSCKHPESNPLRTALHSLADQMRESFGHYQELTDKFEAQHRYETAIYYCQQLDKAEQGATLGYLYLNAGQLADAESSFRALENDEKEEVRMEGLLGLGLVSAARGEHLEAISLLLKVRGDLETRARLDEATVLCYRCDFRAAREHLEKLAPVIEDSLRTLLGVERFGLAPAILLSQIRNLIEEQWVKVHNWLWNIADLYGSLGRCLHELGEPEQSKQNYWLAIEVLHQLSLITEPYHQIALTLGVRLEDLSEHDEAMLYYDDCLEDATDKYREDPDDVYALTNIAWAIAGNLGCLVKNLEHALARFEDSEAGQRVLEDAEQIAHLLQDVPKEWWQAVVVQAVIQSRRNVEQGEGIVEPIGPLSTEDVNELLWVLQDVGRVTGGLELQVLLRLVGWIIDRNQNDQLAQEYFRQLEQKTEMCHQAEACFGLACVHAIHHRYEMALDYLELAISYAPELKNRARLDEDLRSLHDLEGFWKLVQWSGSPIMLSTR